MSKHNRTGKAVISQIADTPMETSSVRRSFRTAKRPVRPNETTETTYTPNRIVFPKALTYDRQNVYEIMFNLLDTAHDIFDRKDGKDYPFVKEAGLSGRNELDRVGDLMHKVFDVHPEMIMSVKQSFLLNPSGFSNQTEFKANSFGDWWGKYLKRTTIKDIQSVKHSLIDNLEKIGEQRSYDFKPELHSLSNMVPGQRALTKVKNKEAVDAIFNTYKSLYIAEDALKGSLTTQSRILTPAMMLDPATLKKGKYDMLFVNCRVIEIPNNDRLRQYLRVEFSNDMYDQQMLCRFKIEMYFYTPASNAVGANRIYEKLKRKASTAFSTFSIDVNTEDLQHTVRLVCYATKDSDLLNRLKFSPLIVLDGTNLRPTGSLETIKTQNGCNEIIQYQRLAGLSVQECVTGISKWKAARYESIINPGKKSSRNETKSDRIRLADDMYKRIIQLFFDIKRMGDSFQVTYLQNFYKHNFGKKMTMYPFFASQDILAICRAMNVHKIASSNQLMKLGIPFLFNIGSRTNKLGSSISYWFAYNIHLKNLKNYLSQKMVNLHSRARLTNQARESENTQTRKKHVIETIKFATKFNGTRSQVANQLFSDLQSYEQIIAHLDNLRRLNKAGRLSYMANLNI